MEQTQKNLIEQSNGRFFGATFIKKDGSIRRLNGRVGVKVNLTGKGMAFSPKEKGMQTVYDIQNKGYRMIALDRLVSFKCGALSL
jgi:hypothetical protein